MYSEILVPLDRSPLAEQVLPYARLFANALELPIELLSIVDPETVNAGSINTSRADSYRYLDGIACSLTRRQPVQCVVEKGDPGERIVTAALARENPLIAMSTHGYSAVQGWLRGSVVARTIQATAHPLLLIRPRQQARGNTVILSTLLVPLDGSPAAEHVLPHVSYLAKTMGLKVVLLRAYRVHVKGHSPRMRQIRETVRDAAQVYLDEKARKLKAEGIASVSCRVEHGNATERIVRVARELPDSLIAMSHGRSGLRWLVLGSVTSRIVRHANDPVLVIPATNGGHVGSSTQYQD